MLKSGFSSQSGGAVIGEFEAAFDTFDAFEEAELELLAEASDGLLVDPSEACWDWELDDG